MKALPPSVRRGPPRRLPALLRHAWFNLNQAFRRRIAPLGLTPDQYTALRTLAEAGAGGLTQRELADRVCSDPNTIAALVARMEASGSIERRPHERDRRANRLRLLEPGLRLFARARPIALELEAELLSAQPRRDRAAFLKRLERLAAAARRAATRPGEETGLRRLPADSGRASNRPQEPFLPVDAGVGSAIAGADPRRRQREKRREKGRGGDPAGGAQGRRPGAAVPGWRARPGGS